MSTSAATAGLNGEDYVDLWTNLYSFVVERMQNAIYKLDHAAQEVISIPKAESNQQKLAQKVFSQLKHVSLKLSVLRSDVVQLKSENWKLLYKPQQ